MRPKELPPLPREGRVALVDLAFAHGSDFDRVTAPFIESAADRLAVWVDHHDHEAWPRYSDDPRFRLRPKTEARACPELIDTELVKTVGPVDTLWAHADFDGCVAAAKFLNGGRAPYPEADEDARWADAPGQGFTCSERGKRLALAMDEAGSSLRTQGYLDLLFDIARSLRDGAESRELTDRIDGLVEGLRSRQLRLRDAYLSDLTRPHPEVLLLDVPKSIDRSDKKFLLREMEERAAVAVINENGHVTAATFHDSGPYGLDLRVIPGLRGQRGFAWGRVEVPRLVASLERPLQRWSRGSSSREIESA